MERERTDFMAHWKELSHWIDPVRGRFLGTLTSTGNKEDNDGRRRNKHIINSTATQAKYKGRSGFYAGTMNPNYPFFKFESLDRELMKNMPVRDFTGRGEAAVRTVLSESNFYSQAAMVIDELIHFGTACMSNVRDFATVAHFHTHTVGTYVYAVDAKGVPCRVAIRKSMTARQMEEAFGLTRMSPQQ